MRINKYIAHATGISRRAADGYLKWGRVTINDKVSELGSSVEVGDVVKLDGRVVTAQIKNTTIMLNKPAGFVCSRDGQGSRTIYDLLPKHLHTLKPIGRLDKESAGLLLMTTDGDLANQLTHPRYGKQKVYQISLANALGTEDRKAIEAGVQLDDGPSALQLKPISSNKIDWEITMSEGRNRQIRRTFEARGNKVLKLVRTQFGDYQLGSIKPREHKLIS